MLFISSILFLLCSTASFSPLASWVAAAVRASAFSISALRSFISASSITSFSILTSSCFLKLWKLVMTSCKFAYKTSMSSFDLASLAFWSSTSLSKTFLSLISFSWRNVSSCTRACNCVTFACSASLATFNSRLLVDDATASGLGTAALIWASKASFWEASWAVRALTCSISLAFSSTSFARDSLFFLSSPLTFLYFFWISSADQPTLVNEVGTARVLGQDGALLPAFVYHYNPVED